MEQKLISEEVNSLLLSSITLEPVKKVHPMVELITEEQIRDITSFLDKEFDIEPAPVRIYKHLEFGKSAYAASYALCFSFKGMISWIVLHEYAHWVNRIRKQQIRERHRMTLTLRHMEECFRTFTFGHAQKKRWQEEWQKRSAAISRSKKRRIRKHHGRDFFLCLRMVILAYCGDLSKYPWHLDYKTIYRWYQEIARRGTLNGDGKLSG